MNDQEPTNNPQIHLSAIDGKDVEEASQIVFHKMKDGSVFIEWYTHSDLMKHGIYQLQATFDKVALDKLREFLNNETTY